MVSPTIDHDIAFTQDKLREMTEKMAALDDDQKSLLLMVLRESERRMVSGSLERILFGGWLRQYDGICVESTCY